MDFSYVAVDTEGYAPLPLGISIANPAMRSMYFPLNHKEDVNIDSETHEFLKLVLNTIRYRIFHNAAHDLIVLPYLFDLPFIDTMIVGHMVDENVLSKGLDYQHKHWCGGEGKIKDETMQMIIDTMGWEYIPFEMLNKYATEDALITMELFIKLKEEYELQFGDFWS